MAGSSIKGTVQDYLSLERAVVISNRDPLGVGRVKIRNINRHGTNEEGIADNDLPWASACIPGGGYDSGSVIIPEEGVTVWIVYENGDIMKPVYLGVCPGAGSAVATYVGDTDGNKRIRQANQTDMPAEYTGPETKILYKSTKGTRIVVNDGDGSESLHIKDALGQGLELNSPMSKSSSAYGSNKFESSEENRKGLSGAASVILNTISGSLLSIISGIKDSVIQLLASGEKKSFLKMSSGEDSTGVKVMSVGDEKSSLILSSGDKANIIIQMDGDKTYQVSLSNSGISLKGKNVDVAISDDKVKFKAPIVEIDTANFISKATSMEISTTSYSVRTESWVTSADSRVDGKGRNVQVYTPVINDIKSVEE